MSKASCPGLIGTLRWLLSLPPIQLAEVRDRYSRTQMKPLLSESQDQESLQALGRASVQIVHDLKNQLNGLKLYATFLRKRMEKSERPAG